MSTEERKRERERSKFWAVQVNFLFMFHMVFLFQGACDTRNHPFCYWSTGCIFSKSPSPLFFSSLDSHFLSFTFSLSLHSFCSLFLCSSEQKEERKRKAKRDNYLGNACTLCLSFSLCDLCHHEERERERERKKERVETESRSLLPLCSFGQVQMCVTVLQVTVSSKRPKEWEWNSWTTATLARHWFDWTRKLCMFHVTQPVTTYQGLKHFHFTHVWNGCFICM